VQLIPVGNSIIYVQPIYIEGESVSRFPIFQFVAVFTQNRDPVLAPTLNDALTQLFGTAPTVAAPGQEPGVNPTNPTNPAQPATVADLLNRIKKDLDDADTALRNGQLGQYQQLVEDANQAAAQALQRQNTSNAVTGNTTATTAPKSGSGS